MSQDENEAATRNQVKWRQDSVATNFPGRDINADNTRNIVATRTKQTCRRDIKTGSRDQFEEAAQKYCCDTIVDVAT